MERKSARRKFRRKYKRYAAAVAGAAILTGVALPGIPVAKALAAENPFTPQNKTEQTTMIDKDTQNPVKKLVASKEWAGKERTTERTRDRDRDNNGWHEHGHGSWPSADDNQGWYENGRIYYRSDNYRYNDYDRYSSVNYLSNAVEIMKANAAKYGFDRYNDSFTLLSQSGNTATIQITKNSTGQRFIVSLERNYDRDWQIVAVRSL